LQTVVGDAKDKDNSVDIQGKEEPSSNNVESDDDFDSDCEIDDSENDISEDDVDLYVDIIDDADISANDAEEKKKQNGREKVKPKQEFCNDGDYEEDDLWAPESDEENVEFRFKTFRPEDLKVVDFKVGQVFESVHLVRKAIRQY
jgi:hypothetical protein